MKASSIALAVPRNARIEIIPLIDVIFFLLATFVLFTLSLNRLQSIPVELPRAGGEPGEVVNLQVSTDGTLFWNNQETAKEELPLRIATLKSQTADPKIMVSGDDKAHFGGMVAVLDELRRADLTKFSIQTQPRPTGK